MLIKLNEKLTDRSPLTVVRNATSFHPRQMINQETVSITRAKKLIQRLFDLNILTSTESDNAKREYELFIQMKVHQNKYHFSSFDKDKQGLDTFLGKYISGNADYVHSWKVPARQGLKEGLELMKSSWWRTCRKNRYSLRELYGINFLATDLIWKITKYLENSY